MQMLSHSMKMIQIEWDYSTGGRFSQEFRKHILILIKDRCQ